ncbi:DUF4350 domain-containing protein [Nocardioides pyridinolyticus]
MRRHRTTILVVVGLLVAVAIVAFTSSRVTTGAALDPDNPSPGGAQAVARVLEDQGVEVTVARDADAFDAARVDAATTVLVTSADLLGRSTIRRLLRHAGDATLVLAEPPPGTTRALGVRAAPAGVSMQDPRPAGCPAYDGLELVVDRGSEYPVDGGCFGGLLAEPEDGLVLLGAADAISNGEVLRADNAAVALRLLGAHDRLVWYVPDLADLDADDGVSLATLLPEWLRPALWIGFLATLGLLLWRVRRLGPLATEPLPVVVKAIETTHSRGRLYRKAGDRAHAAHALRAAARQRAAERLALGPHADPAALVRDLARHTGRPVEDVERLLGPSAPAPTTDHDLIALASALAELDREVRRP